MTNEFDFTEEQVLVPTNVFSYKFGESFNIDTIDSYVKGADGHTIILRNYSGARNPSWNELLSFLKNDDTDEYAYNNGFKCCDFAELLHNNAEAAGWRCAFVVVHISRFVEGHALNAFETTDRGLIFIDSTGSNLPKSPKNQDKIVKVEVGKPYIPESLFPETGWNIKWENKGIVDTIKIIQW